VLQPKKQRPERPKKSLISSSPKKKVINKLGLGSLGKLQKD